MKRYLNGFRQFLVHNVKKLPDTPVHIYNGRHEQR